MDYHENKTLDIIRESTVKTIMELRNEALTALGNPYAALNTELTAHEHAIINHNSHEAFILIKEKGLIK